MYSILLLEEDAEILTTATNIILKNFSKEIKALKPFNTEEQLLSFVEDHREQTEIVIIGMKKAVCHGVAIAKKIKEFRGDAKIIFMCDSGAYNPAIYDVEHVFYLKKPLAEKLVCKAILKAKLGLQQEGDSFFSVFTKSQTYRISLQTIVYIEKEKRLTHIITDEGQRISYYSTFKELYSHLNETFYRCHNSYIINTAFVKNTGAGCVEMENGAIIPVSRNKTLELKELCLKMYSTKCI